MKKANSRMKQEHGLQQKLNEHRFAEAAALLLGAQWELVSRHDESKGGPDFIVHENNRSFGLEVRDVFKGVGSEKRGAVLKRNQSDNQLFIDQIRQRYENVAGNIPLYVKFVDTPHESQIDRIVHQLCKMNLERKSFPYQSSFTIEQKPGPLKIFVSRLPDYWERDRLYRRDWFNVADAGGFVEKNHETVLKSISEKSTRLDLYKRNVAKSLGLTNPLDADVRLLLVADHMWNFGKVELSDEWDGNLHGFNAVYFLRYPDRITLLR